MYVIVFDGTPTYLKDYFVLLNAYFTWKVGLETYRQPIDLLGNPAACLFCGTVKVGPTIRSWLIDSTPTKTAQKILIQLNILVVGLLAIL